MTDRDRIREFLERLPKASDEYLAQKLSIPVEEVSEHVGILTHGGG